jgi:tetratricopeptide (TPR) repeat protein
MKRGLLSLMLLPALLLAAADAARAQEMSPRDIFPQAAQAAREGDVDSAAKKTQELIQTGRQYGVRTFPLYAAGAASVARQSSRDGKKDVAEWGRSAATQLDSDSAAVSFTLADEAAVNNNWAGAIQASVRGFQQLFRGYRTNLLSRSDLLIVFVAATAISAIILAVVLFLRYARSMAHDFRERLGQRVHGGSVSVLAFALLFLPIFIWLGPMWLVFYWFAIFFPYASARERVFIVTMALLVASLPLLLDRAATSIAGVDSPPVLAAISNAEKSYQPEALRRMQDLVALIPDNSTLHVLLGNLYAFEGNEQQAGEHYRRAIQINDSAGAHVNLGNLHFMQNDYAAAMNEYANAQKKDSQLAIAFYNDSVANGETYKFQEQGQKLEQAKKIDPAGIAKLSELQRSANGPVLKVAMYHPPVAEAWQVESAIARRGVARSLFGNYAYFDVVGSALNPVTIGAIASLLLALGLWLKRRKGLAGSCIKCGRTFCHRCKSARESATYCTQCIHIYLKRDGVALATKRAKVDEVSDHYAGVQRRNRLFATFLPGSAQLLEGRTIVGMLGAFLFFFFVCEALAIGRLAPALGPVASTAQTIVRSLAIIVAIIIWLMLSIPVYRRRAVAP